MLHATRLLSPDTWPDFERLFAPGTGWAFCACMLHQRGCHLDRRVYGDRAACRLENLRQKRALVDAGEAHGIIVYVDAEPVGWCQFGPARELPRAGAPRLDRRIPPLAADVDWRITCFVTARTHRRRGVAKSALRSAVEAIERLDGGTVEAYPTTNPRNADRQHAGTPGMFEAAGFTVHARPSAPYVVMRRRVGHRV